MKILTLGDPHFKVNNLTMMKKYSENVFIQAKMKNPDIIVILGDVLHEHSIINTFALHDASQFITKLSENFRVILLIGNHDRPNNSDFQSNYHPFLGMKCVDSFENKNNGLIICHRTTKISIKNFTFLGVPYVQPGRFEEAICNFKDDFENIDLIFAHQEFKGAWMGKIQSQNGDLWDIKYPPVISGHIHSFQIIQENLVYVGTAVQHTFGEGKDKKGIYLISHQKISEKSKEYKFKLCSLKENYRWYGELIPLNLPQKITMKTDVSEFHKLKLSSLDKFSEGTIRIIISGNSSELKSIAKTKKITNFRRSGIKIVFKILSPSSSLNENIDDKRKNEFKPKNFFDLLSGKIATNSGAIKIFKKLHDD